MDSCSVVATRWSFRYARGGEQIALPLLVLHSSRLSLTLEIVERIR